MEDERRFAAAARVSEINLDLYRTFAQPIVRAFATPSTAAFMQRMHPLRLQYEMLAETNPFMKWVGQAAQQVREDRRAVAQDNPLVKMQEVASNGIVDALDSWRDITEQMSEKMFLSIYGSPVLQAAVGIDPKATEPMRKAGKSTLHLQLVEKRIAELKAKIPEGGIREALVRAVLYVGMARGSMDERGFEVVRRVRQAQKELPALSLEQFKALVREQYFMLIIDPTTAVETIPLMLPPARETRAKAFDLVQDILKSSGDFPPEGQKRLQQIKTLFGSGSDQTPTPVIEHRTQQIARSTRFAERN